MTLLILALQLQGMRNVVVMVAHIGSMAVMSVSHRDPRTYP
jgi:hypothetical protein